MDILKLLDFLGNYLSAWERSNTAQVSLTVFKTSVENIKHGPKFKEKKQLRQYSLEQETETCLSKSAAISVKYWHGACWYT